MVILVGKMKPKFRTDGYIYKALIIGCHSGKNSSSLTLPFFSIFILNFIVLTHIPNT
jgi:hypothetical protein